MSLFSRRMFMAQNVKRAVAGWEITFTVKEWFLDPDNSFTDTEVGALQYMTVKIGSETKQTDANGQVVFTLADGAYTYEVYDNARYLTTYRDDITVSGATQSISVKCYACLYKPTDVWDMINNDSYVPVASGAELDSLRNTGSRTMGAKTIFVGSYATGLDKKYVQVLTSFELTDFVVFGNSVNKFSGIYDGNNLFIDYEFSNITFPTSIFGYTNNSTISNINIIAAIDRQTYYLCSVVSSYNSINCIISNINVFGYVNGNYYVAAIILDNYGLIDNCQVEANIESFAIVTNILTSAIASRNYGTIQNSHVFNSIIKNIALNTTYNQHIAAFVSFNGNTGIVLDCSVTNSNVESTGKQRAGLFCGTNNGEIQRCYASGSLVAEGSYNGGFVGITQTGTGNCKIIDSYADVEVTINNALTGNGGFTGYNNRVLTNCYAKGLLISAGTSRGGFVGYNAGTITNSYYDSQTSGQSDTGKGLPRTTAQMQAGTASSYILPDGTTDPDSLPVNAMYLNWDGNIWEFGTTSEYPTLK